MNSAFGSGIPQTLHSAFDHTKFGSNGVLNIERPILVFGIQNAISNGERSHERKKKSVRRLKTTSQCCSTVL